METIQISNAVLHKNIQHSILGDADNIDHIPAYHRDGM